MKALDAARGAIETAKLYIPAGWDLAKLMYSNLEGSVADLAFDLGVNIASYLDKTGLISTTAFIIDVGKLRINLKAIEKTLVQLGSFTTRFSSISIRYVPGAVKPNGNTCVGSA